MYLTDEQYRLVLERIRAAIEAGVPLEAGDNTTPGNKYTECTWGLCSNSFDYWTKESSFHLFPEQVKQGRSSPKYRKDGQLCPMDGHIVGDPMGCFYRCKVFQADRQHPPPTREEALQLYDLRLRPSKPSTNIFFGKRQGRKSIEAVIQHLNRASLQTKIDWIGKKYASLNNLWVEDDRLLAKVPREFIIFTDSYGVQTRLSEIPQEKDER